MDKLKVGDYVRYATNGICFVLETKQMSLSRNALPSEYYVLKPIVEQKSLIYIPKDNKNILNKITGVLNKEQINNIILESRENPMEWIADRNNRNVFFQGILNQSDQGELLRLINCIYIKRKELIEQKKKLSSIDENALNRAIKLIESDFAFILEIKESEVGEYIRKLLNI